MVGRIAHKLSYSNRLVWQILQGEIPIDTNITLNWVDVQDVARGAYQAMQQGRDGERYILANERHTSIQESVQMAAAAFPKLRLRLPQKAPKSFLYLVASLMEFGSCWTGREPLLQRQYLDMFYGLKQDYDISKAQMELDFHPKSSEEALLDAIRYLREEWKPVG
ncbi:MAG: dihydrokaempferol 4-reductase, partial [Bacteroidota bacterium]